MKIGVVPYLNALPLTKFLNHPVTFGTPRQLDSQIRNGELDVALLPVFSFFQNPAFLPLFEAGAIQSDGPVESVALFYREKFETPSFIRTINYSEESITSISLFKVLYSYFWRRNLSSLKETKNEGDARLLIGDKALFFNEPGWRRLDLGEEWKKQTDLPFVYAIWVAREPLDQADVQMLVHAKKEGLKRIEEIVEGINDWPKERLYPYLTKNIQYEITLRSLEGLKKFQDYCYEIGILKEKRRLLGL